MLGSLNSELGTLNLGSWQNLSPLDRKCDLDVTKMSKEIDRTMKARPRVAAVIQRYGPEVLGGESLCRAVVERFLRKLDITVRTACAEEYVTWKNVYRKDLRRWRACRWSAFP